MLVAALLGVMLIPACLLELHRLVTHVKWLRRKQLSLPYLTLEIHSPTANHRGIGVPEPQVASS